MKKRKTRYSQENFSQLILEPEDWSEDEWATILKVFGMEEAERIVLSDYTLEAYGTKKEDTK